MGGGGGSHRVSPDTRLAKYGRPLTGSITVSHPGGRGGGVGKPGVIFMVLYLLLPIHYFSSRPSTRVSRQIAARRLCLV